MKRTSFRPSWLSSSALGAVAALVLGTAGPAAADPTDDVMAKLRTGAGCAEKVSEHKIWCPAADWARGKPHTMKPGLWIGFSVSVEADTDIATALSDDLSLVMLRVDKDGPQLSAQLKEVEGAPGVDTRQVDATSKQVAAALAGKGKVALTGGVKALAASLKGRGTRAMNRTKASWVWTTESGSVELREVGKTFVVVETPAGDVPGRTITILTDRVK